LPLNGALGIQTSGMIMNLNITQKLFAIYSLAILMLVAISVASIVFQIPIPLFTRDVTAIANIHPLSGILSNLGIYLWCISAMVSFFAAMVLRDIDQNRYLSFLFSSAFLSTYLMLDDAFLFHEALAPKLLGIDEKAVFIVLGIAVLLYLKFFMQIILKTKYMTLLLAFVFLSLSVVIDSIFEPWLWRLGEWQFLIEDGAKWLGIVSWCIYHVRTSFLFIVNEYELPNK
jgi:hypothetical protein